MDKLTPEIRKTILERLYLAKRLAVQGQQSCSDHTDTIEFSKGVLSLQDAIELALGALATALGVGLKPKTSFHEYFTEIDKNLSKKNMETLPSRRELKLLNDARISIKHDGALSNLKAMPSYVGAVEPFLRQVVNVILELDYEHLSLADFIRNKEIRELIKTAEDNIKNGDMKDAVKLMAQTRHVLIGKDFVHGGLLRALLTPQGQDVTSPEVDWEEIDSKELDRLLLRRHIDIAGFERLGHILPVVGRNTRSRNLEYWWYGEKCHEGNWTPPILREAIETLIDVAMKCEEYKPLEGIEDRCLHFSFIITATVEEAIFYNYGPDEIKQIGWTRPPRSMVDPRKKIYSLKRADSLEVRSVDRNHQTPQWVSVISSFNQDAGGKLAIGYVRANEVEVKEIKRETKG